jgi:hypothetical protein
MLGVPTNTITFAQFGFDIFTGFRLTGVSSGLSLRKASRPCDCASSIVLRVIPWKAFWLESLFSPPEVEVK